MVVVLMRRWKMVTMEAIRKTLDEMYDNMSEKGGRPNCDVILAFKNFVWVGSGTEINCLIV